MTAPVTGGAVLDYSYRDLQREIASFAGVLAGQDVTKGDRVIIYMPMIPEAVIAMMACARIGAIHCVVFGGFASRELQLRIDDAKPKVIVSASCGIETGNKVLDYRPLLDNAIRGAIHKPRALIVKQRPLQPINLSREREIIGVLP